MRIYTFISKKKNLNKNNEIHFTQSGHLKVQQMGENLLETVTQDVLTKTKTKETKQKNTICKIPSCK